MLLRVAERKKRDLLCCPASIEFFAIRRNIAITSGGRLRKKKEKIFHPPVEQRPRVGVPEKGVKKRINAEPFFRPLPPSAAGDRQIRDIRRGGGHTCREEEEEEKKTGAKKAGEASEGYFLAGPAAERKREKERWWGGGCTSALHR